MVVQNNLRKPVVAGQFYPRDAKGLNKVISSFADKEGQKRDAIGAILPHAGYVYSGLVAAQTVCGINIKNNVVLLGTNHTGLGPEFSIMPSGIWQTPLGELEVNAELSNLFLNKSVNLRADILAHKNEHSLEVELPILQYFKKTFKIIPIAIRSLNLGLLKSLAKELAEVINENNLIKSTVFIASSDLTHYEPQEIAERKDALAIDAIVALDEDELGRVVNDEHISMCGFAPVAVLIKTAKLLGAKGGQLIKYQTSGQASGDFSSVVGYAGITIY
ncbi:MAG: AmmeMemoRadiSam system protein B [Candidatus Omnitrophica bacterium]|jgi:hypothetical protein|nr:AmmeMemoRadiSam system protein B [Candidatus Omnitrophota bacterium]MDD5660485.1 AmmeMemoRadiSam system protein B [Candidatus Omnitrophota bacterium]